MTALLRAHQAVLLAGPSARVTPWVPLVAAFVLAALGLLPAVVGAAAPASQTWALRIAAVLLGAGACFAMVETMTAVSVSPTPRALRQWLRIAVVLLPAAAMWTVLYVVAAVTLPHGGTAGGSLSADALPLPDLGVEALVCAAASLAGAAVAARSGNTSTTAVAGPATQGILLAGSLFVPRQWSPWALPPSPRWDAVHDGWRVALIVCLAVLLAANREIRPVLHHHRPRGASPG